MQNRRVTIRAPQLGDCETFLSAVRRSRQLHKQWVTRKTKNKKEFADYLKRFSTDRCHGYLVIHRGSGDLVGFIGINEVIRGAFQNGSLGYYAFSPFAGQGLMYEGLQLVLRRAFGELKLHRVEANIQPGNKASIALVKKCGFVCEGLARRMLKINGHWRDHERWALLAENFNRDYIVR